MECHQIFSIAVLSLDPVYVSSSKSIVIFLQYLPNLALADGVAPTLTPDRLTYNPRHLSA